MTVLIKDLSELLNFRHNPKKFLLWDSVKRDITDYEERALNAYPDVYGHFGFAALDVKAVRKNGFVIPESKLRPEALHKRNVYSRDVFIKPARTKQMIREFIREGPGCYDNLVIAGEDTKLSSIIHYFRPFKHLFKQIYIEAKDIECDWVRAIPMGVNYAYTLRSGGNEVVLPHINKKKNKTKLIASAFGSKWGHLTQRIPDRRRLKRFTTESDFMDDMFCDPLEYYEKLCDYKFFASPLGQGIQTPKICESILCETVPVVTDHVAHRELRDIYGLPLLIVKKWKDLNEDFLNEQWDAVYSKLDWDTQKNKFLARNFNKLLVV